MLSIGKPIPIRSCRFSLKFSYKIQKETEPDWALLSAYVSIWLSVQKGFSLPADPLTVVQRPRTLRDAECPLAAPNRCREKRSPAAADHAHWAALKSEMQRERWRRKSPENQQTCDKEPTLNQLLSELNVNEMCPQEYILDHFFLDILEEARKKQWSLTDCYLDRYTGWILDRCHTCCWQTG